jgi:hypothetical protein
LGFVFRKIDHSRQKNTPSSGESGQKNFAPPDLSHGSG